MHEYWCLGPSMNVCRWLCLPQRSVTIKKFEQVSHISRTFSSKVLWLESARCEPYGTLATCWMTNSFIKDDFSSQSNFMTTPPTLHFFSSQGEGWINCQTFYDLRGKKHLNTIIKYLKLPFMNVFILATKSNLLWSHICCSKYLGQKSKWRS